LAQPLDGLSHEVLSSHRTKSFEDRCYGSSDCTILLETHELLIRGKESKGHDEIAISLEGPEGFRCRVCHMNPAQASCAKEVACEELGYFTLARQGPDAYVLGLVGTGSDL
jgi:hypothetical protein